MKEKGEEDPSLKDKSLDGFHKIGRKETLASIFAGASPPRFVDCFHITDDITRFKRELSVILCEDQRSFKGHLSNDKLHNAAAEASNTNLLGSHIMLSHAEAFLVMSRVRRKNVF